MFLTKQPYISTLLFIIDFYCCCDEISDKKQLREGRMYSSSQFRGMQSIIVGRHKGFQFRGTKSSILGEGTEAGWLSLWCQPQRNKNQYSFGQLFFPLHAVWAPTT